MIAPVSRTWVIAPLPVVTRAVASESAPGAQAEVSASARPITFGITACTRTWRPVTVPPPMAVLVVPMVCPRRAFTSVSALPANPPMSAVERA